MISRVLRSTDTGSGLPLYVHFRYFARECGQIAIGIIVEGEDDLDFMMDRDTAVEFVNVMKELLATEEDGGRQSDA